MFKTILNYFRSLFIGGPTFLKVQGREIFWPSNVPINAFPINVYLTASGEKVYGSAASDCVSNLNMILGFRAFNHPVPARIGNLRDIFDKAASGGPQPNLRGLILIDTEDRLTKSNTTLYYATKPYPHFNEEVGSMRCAFVDMVSDPYAGMAYNTLLHEFMHCLGLGHDTETASIMNEFLSPFDQYIITPKTTKALREKYRHLVGV